MEKGKESRTLSLYPLKFEDVISDVLKMKPPNKRKVKARKKLVTAKLGK